MVDLYDTDTDVDTHLLHEPVFDMSSTSDSDSLSVPPFDFEEDEDVGDGGPQGRQAPPDSDDIFLNDISDILEGEFSKMERE